MNTQPALQLLQVPPALGSTGTQGRQAVGGFAELLEQKAPTDGLVKDLAIAGLSEQGLDSTASLGGSPNGWVVPHQVEPELPVLIAASEEGQIPVALATGVPRDAFAYGGEPEAHPSDLLSGQSSVTTNALGQSVMTVLDVDEELRNEVLLAAATQSVVMELNAQRVSSGKPLSGSSDRHNLETVRLDLASNRSALSTNKAAPSLQEAMLEASNAQSTMDDLTPQSNAMSAQSLARDEVLTKATLRSDAASKNKTLFRRPAHEPAPRVGVSEQSDVLSNVEKQLASQSTATKPNPESVLRTVSNAPKRQGDESEPDADRFGLDQETAEAAPEFKGVRLADHRDEDPDSKLEFLGQSRKASQFMDEVEAEIEILEANDLDVITPENTLHRPTTTLQVDVDVDEDLSVKIDARGHEVSVTLDGTNSALDDLKDVGRELAESLRRMGFDLSEFNTEERDQLDNADKTKGDENTGRNATKETTEKVASKVRRGHRVDMTA